MLNFDTIPMPAVLPVATLAAELTQGNEVAVYVFGPDLPQPTPKLAAIDGSTMVDGVTPDFPQPKPK